MKRTYQTDLSNAEWSCLEPHLPAPKPNGRPRVYPLREILNAIFCVLRSGCSWRFQERSGTKQDDIRAKDGDDTVNARRAGNDADTVHGQTGNDTIKTNDGDTRDQVDCGQGTDTAIIDVKKQDATDPTKITSSDKVDSDCETIKD
jgi:Putative transposase of IS4/5 family (DUF4096)